MGLYQVFLGVFGFSNPGHHAIAMVITKEDRRNEWAKVIGESTTPNAWRVAVQHAFERVKRPNDVIEIAVRDQNLVARYQLVGQEPSLFREPFSDQPNTTVIWIAKASEHPEMNRAHDLARSLLCQEARKKPEDESDAV